MIDRKNTFSLVEPGWTGLYRVVVFCALFAVLFMLLDIALSFSGGDLPVGELSAEDWFIHLQQNGFTSLRNLGLFNVITLTLAVPVYLAIFHLHRRNSPVLASLALIFCLLGTGIYIANNRALALWELSGRYAETASETQKAVLAAAGTTLLAQAEDFTPGAFAGFLFSSLASLLMMGAMLRGKVFNRWVSLSGLVGTACLLVFTISATFAPTTVPVFMVLALVGGLLMMGWNIAVVFVMFRLGRGKEILSIPATARLIDIQDEA